MRTTFSTPVTPTRDSAIGTGGVRAWTSSLSAAGDGAPPPRVRMRMTLTVARRRGRADGVWAVAPRPPILVSIGTQRRTRAIGVGGLCSSGVDLSVQEERLTIPVDHVVELDELSATVGGERLAEDGVRVHDVRERGRRAVLRELPGADFESSGDPSLDSLRLYLRSIG